MRRGLSRDLGYGVDDRSENLRRSAEVARLVNNAGMLCICAFVAPHAAVRQRVRNLLGDDNVIEVHLAALEVSASATAPACTPAPSAASSRPSRRRARPTHDLLLPTDILAPEM